MSFVPFLMAAVAIWLCGFAAYVTGRIKTYQLDGMLALGQAAVGIGSVYEGSWVGAIANSAVTAWSAYRWWNGGGGDDTKRRLRKLGRAFTGVRRTAPTGA